MSLNVNSSRKDISVRDYLCCFYPILSPKSIVNQSKIVENELQKIYNVNKFYRHIKKSYQLPATSFHALFGNIPRTTVIKRYFVFIRLYSPRLPLLGRSVGRVSGGHGVAVAAVAVPLRSDAKPFSLRSPMEPSLPGPVCGSLRIAYVSV